MWIYKMEISQTPRGEITRQKPRIGQHRGISLQNIPSIEAFWRQPQIHLPLGVKAFFKPVLLHTEHMRRNHSRKRTQNTEP